MPLKGDLTMVISHPRVHTTDASLLRAVMGSRAYVDASLGILSLMIPSLSSATWDSKFYGCVVVGCSASGSFGEMLREQLVVPAEGIVLTSAPGSTFMGRELPPWLVMIFCVV